MKEEYVTYEQADKLKELGFDWECNHFYTCHTSKMLCESTTLLGFNELSDFEHNFNAYAQNNHRQPTFNPYCSAPRLDQAQKWLRVVKHIYVYPEINCLKKWFAKAVDMERNEDLIWDGAMFDTYELALSAGIDKALELLTDNQPTKV